MANTTSEYWSVGGQSLQTLAFNIETWGGSRQGVPDRRGDDLIVPFRSGRVFMPKVADSRTISLGMWVVGADENGLVPQGGVSRYLFEENWRKLRELFWGSSREELVVTKTIFRYVGGVRTAVPVSAKAFFSGGLEPTMNGGTRARFVVDLYLADPWFYPLTPLTHTFTAANQTWNLSKDIVGDDPTDLISLQLTGTWSNAALTNQDNVGPSNTPVSIKFNGALSSTQISNSVSLSVRDQLALDNNNARTFSGLVSHQGSRSWFEILGKRDQTIKFTASSGTGSALLSIYPRYF